MSKMYAEISRIVTEDISPRVNQYNVLFEAITNAIHANATEISVYLNSNDNLIKENDLDISTVRLDEIMIVDNGEGLTDINYKSFSTYRTEYKKDIGCKGVGRFVFLKVYKHVEYTSLLTEIQEERQVNFHLHFDTEDLKKARKEIYTNETTVKLSSLTTQYFDPDRRVDRRIPLDIYSIRQKVLMNLIPTLFFYRKNKNREIKISFIDQYSYKSVSIQPTDIPNFEEKTFIVKNGDGNPFEFKLYHKIDNVNGNLNASYCAHNRTVADFEDKDLKISLPYGYSGFLLLTSEYFNSKVNNERNDFDIWPVKTDMFSTLSWEMINAELKKSTSEIIKAGIPQTKKINREKLQDIKEERPYLISYIEEEDLDMAGFLDKKIIIEKAKKKFDTAKEKVLANAGKEEFSDEELNEAILITQNELVSYINDRVIVIEKLKSLLDKSERVESIIHNLFMEKYSKDDYYAVGKNNLWLLDDRFTTYSYAASDRKIKQVLDDLGESTEDVEILGDKPDLSLFFSHNPAYPKRLKSVVVEIKPFDYAAKPERKKYEGITQLRGYLKAFKSRENIEEIHGYLVTEVDSKLATLLVEDNFTPLFSSETPIYHRFYDKIGVSIYVVSAKTLICDAEARNKVFLDIIRKQARINKLIGNHPAIS